MSPEDYLAQTHVHVVENIKLADQKATAFVVIDSAVLGALYGAKLLIPVTSCPVIMILSLTTFGLLALGVVLACRVLWPEGEKMAHRVPGGELAIPSKIYGQHASPESYRDAVVAAQGNLTAQLASLTWVRCKTNDVKYWYLRQAIRASVLGLASAAVFVLVQAAR